MDADGGDAGRAAVGVGEGLRAGALVGLATSVGAGVDTGVGDVLASAALVGEEASVGAGATAGALVGVGKRVGAAYCGTSPGAVAKV